MRAIVRWITAFNRGLAASAGLLTALITLIVCIDVASRTLLNHSVRGASELAILMLVALVFLGLAGAEAKGDNFSVTSLVRLFGRRAQRALKVIANLIGLGAIGLLAWFSWSRGIAATVAGEQSYGVIAFPVWPSRLIIAFGLTMLCLQLIAGILKAIWGDDAGSAT
jgi:TRAP-type C4-dicarboxylate transport system permease small subunit